MIFVTLGTQDKSFERLLEMVDSQIESGLINEEVVVQAGFTKYESNKMKIYDYIPMDEFDKIVDNCSLLITHGGVGNIMTGMERGKKVIAIPRLKKYKEHINDHQLQIVNNFSKEGYILKAIDESEFIDSMKKIKKFNPKKFKSNKDNFINMLCQEIDSD